MSYIYIKKTFTYQNHQFTPGVWIVEDWFADQTSAWISEKRARNATGDEITAYEVHQEEGPIYKGDKGDKGDPGDPGTNGTNGLNADVTRTSTTSLAIASSGSKTLNYSSSSNLGWLVGSRLRFAHDASNYMEGVVSAVSSTSVTITVDNSLGSGTYATWNIVVAGDKGVFDTNSLTEAEADVPSTAVLANNDLVRVIQSDVVVAGAGTSEANGRYTYRGLLNGKPFYNLDGQPDSETDYVIMTDGNWQIRGGGAFSGYQFYVASDTDFPWNVFDWSSVDGNDPPPTVSEDLISKKILKNFISPRQDSFASIDVTIIGTSLSDGPLTADVIEGKSYDIEAILFTTNDVHALNVDFGGTATVSHANGYWSGNNVSISIISDLGTDYGPSAFDTIPAVYRFKGIVEVSGSGTLLLRFAQRAGGTDITTLLAGSLLTCTRVN